MNRSSEKMFGNVCRGFAGVLDNETPAKVLSLSATEACRCNCGKLITVGLMKGNYVYYFYTDESRAECGRDYVAEYKISEVFSQLLKSLIITDEMMGWIRSEHREAVADWRSNRNRREQTISQGVGRF